MANKSGGMAAGPSWTAGVWAAAFGLALISLSSHAQGQIDGLDFGDAPPPYPTVAKADGARHAPLQGFFLGAWLDLESDGQPDLHALGDDQNPPKSPDDEDGVTFLPPILSPGNKAEVEVVASLKGRLDAWIDFDQDGKWDPATETVFNAQPLASGVNSLSFIVPRNIVPGTTYARFRLSQEGHLQPTGFAPDGEVEDYELQVGETQVGEFDFGDAPDTYRTLLKADGPRHQPLQGFFLGKLLDLEPDGQPGVDASGDDLNPAGAGDDEDGVVFTTPLVPGNSAGVNVLASTSGRLDAWVDFGRDGSFADKGDRIFTAEPLVGGANALTFVVPSSATTDRTFARFRLSREGGLNYFGPAIDGEVEDYVVSIQRRFDFGDAPAPYPTLLADDGARHVRNSDVFLGMRIDEEADGQPTGDATGDDLNPAGSPSDEDGIINGSDAHPGEVVTLEVRASTSGLLNGWLDFEGDGSWAELEDQIFKNVPLTGGINTLTFDVPSTAKLGRTYARLRFNLKGGLSYDGPASDGEVEDYLVEITEPPGPCDRTNKGRDFWLTFPGNYAPDPDNPLKLSLCIVGPRNTVGVVEIPGLEWTKPFIIGGDQKATIALPPEADLGDANDEVGDNGIHVTAENEVAVFGLNRVLYTTDGYLGLPSDVIGKGYIIQAFGNVHEGVPSLNGTQFGLVACQDQTTVTISPSVATTGHAQGVPYQIKLDQGQTYQLRNTRDAPRDLSGTIVVADKPIAVFGSHQCANIPNKDVWFCDYIVEQLLPIVRAGSEFVTMPLATRTGGDTFRFYSVVNGSQVFVNGSHVATLNLGEFHEMKIADPALIVAEGAIFTVQYANSSDFDLVRISDPFELVIPPVEMFRTEYEICVPDSGFDSHYLNVVVRKGGQGIVTLDGAPIPAGDYVPIGGGAYFGAQVPVAPGVHFLSGQGSSTVNLLIPFGLSVYGWAEYDSYGYPGGMFFPDKEPPRLTCPTDNLVVEAQGGLASVCMAPVPDVTQWVKFTDNCPLSPNTVVVQNPPAGTSVAPGEHQILVSVTDAAGNVGRCSIGLTVLDLSPPSIDCPSGPTVTCTSGKGAVVEFNVPAFTACGTPLPVTCDPPSGSLFPPGTTIVTCTAVNDAGEVATCSFPVTVSCLGIVVGQQAGTLVITGIKGALQTADSVAGPWVAVPGASSTYTVQATDRHRFFRVKF